jgi:hypothetical protein
MEQFETGRGGDAREGCAVIRWCAGCRATASPEGRRAAALGLTMKPGSLNDQNKPNKLYDSVTRLQGVCGQPCRSPRRQAFVAEVVNRGRRRQAIVAGMKNRSLRRGRSTAGIYTSAPRNRARGKLPRLSGALRATCTLPTVFPSLRAHEPNPAGHEIHPDLAGEMLEKYASCGPDCSGGTQEVNLVKPESEPKGPGHSVHEPAHAHIHRSTQRQERKQHRRSAVTH